MRIFDASWRIAVYAGVAAALLISVARAQTQNSAQSACIVTANKGAAKLAKTVGKEIGRCLKNAQRGALPAGQTADDCPSADASGKIAKVRTKLARDESKKCADQPDFGFAGSQAAAAAVETHELDLARDIFGADLDGAWSPSVGSVASRCQSAVQRAYEKVVATKLREFNACKKDGLNAARIGSAEQLAGCLDAISIDARGKVARAVDKLRRQVAALCGDVGSTATPGSCSGASDLGGCIDERVECRTCRMLAAIDALALDCDTFDDGTANGSCGAGGVTSTTVVTTTTVTTTTVPSTCGNGVLESGEDCDDGNLDPGDCCAADCAFEPAEAVCGDDGNPCTDDFCDGAGTCGHADNEAPCDDGVFCNGADACAAGACGGHAGDPCSQGGACGSTCNEAADSCGAPDGTPCDDGLFCTLNDACRSGVCTGAGDPCAGGGACANGCNEIADSCYLASGTPCADDGNPCTDDACNGAGACSHAPNSAPCDDGLFCNGLDFCTGGACLVHSGDPCAGGVECATVCNEAADTCSLPFGTPCTDDGNVCTDDVCDGVGSCSHSPNAAACDDGLFCNGGDFCSAGSCSAHTGDPCSGPDGDDDCRESCDESIDACTADDANGSGCDDGLFCTASDTCQAGVCIGAGDPCAGGGPCADLCRESGETCNRPLGTSCTDDADVCTADVCDAVGACAHMPAPETAPGATTAGVRVVVVNSGPVIADIDAAEAVLAAAPMAGDGRGVFATVNHGDAQGRFGSAEKAAYPGASGSDFAVEATGVIEVPAAGFYVFGTSSDDGFRLRFGPSLTTLSDAAGVLVGGDERVVVEFADRGRYPFRLTHYQSGGEAFVELYAKSGTNTAFTGDERLVGDVGNGGLAVYAGGGLFVRDVHGSTQVASLADAEALLSGSGALFESTASVVALDLRDGGGDGRYAGGSQFPAGGGDDFAVEVTAIVLVPEAGQWTFGVRSDDGARLTIGGVDVVVDDAVAGPAEGLGVFDAPAAGLFKLRLVHFERAGDAELELFAAKGAHAAFDPAAFRLVGDAAAGGLSAFVPESAVPPAKKVLIVGVDGCRPDALQAANTPSFDALVANGSVSWTAQTGDTTWSGPGWSSILTAVWRDKHGVVDNTFSGKNYASYPDWMNHLKSHAPMSVTSSIVNWNPINDEIVSGADLELSGLSDNGVASAAVTRLLDHDDDVIFLAFNDVDAAGHACCFSPTDSDYRDAIESTDARLGTIMTALQARPGVINGDEDWLVLSVTDHGGTSFFHGSDIPEHRTIFYISSGPSAKQGGAIIYPTPNQVDIGATVLTHFGIAIDPAWQLDGTASGFPTETVFGENLVFNGDGEYSLGYTAMTNDGSNGGRQVGAGIAGWIDVQSMTVVRYGSSGFPSGASPGPAVRGTNFLAGGNEANTTSTQTIDVSDVAADIGTGGVSYDLSGWIGGFGTQDDRMQLTARFLSASGTVLAIDAIGPVTAAQRGNVTGLLFRQAVGSVPTGTRRIELELAATRASGTDNDAYADNLSLVLSEP